MVMTPLAKVLLSFDQALFLALRSHLCLTTFTVMLICRYLSNYLFISSKKKRKAPCATAILAPILLEKKVHFHFFSRSLEGLRQMLTFPVFCFHFLFFFFVVAF